MFIHLEWEETAEALLHEMGESPRQQIMNICLPLKTLQSPGEYNFSRSGRRLSREEYKMASKSDPLLNYFWRVQGRM